MNILSRRLRLTLAAFFFLLLFTTIDARAQWQYRSTPGYARFVEMLDYVGKPETGFVGGLNGLVITTDNGFTWQDCLIKGGSTFHVKDIQFKDGTTGWIATDAGIFRTTDGGSNWELVRSGSFAAVHYNASRTMVLASGRNVPSCESIDDGNSWLVFGASSMNGFAQLSDNYIFHSTFKGQGWFTTNGGVSWIASGLTAEVWQPVHLELSGRYLAISEVTDEVFVSDDRGEDWEQISMLIDPTGCVLGTEEKLFAQTEFGMYYSTDQGTTWVTICGPENNLDTRFWVRGEEIFALNEGGQLFYNPNAQPGGYERVQPRVDDGLHQIVMDTTCVLNEVEIPLQNLGCDKFNIDSVTINDPVHFELTGFSPVTVEGQSGATIKVKARKLTKNHHEAIVSIYVSNPDDHRVVYDTISMDWKPIVMVQPMKDARYSFTECKTESGAVDIFNPACSPIRIDSIQYTNRTDFTFMVLTFPFEIGPREHFSLTYDVHFPKPAAETNVKVYFTLGDTQYQQNMWVRSSSYVKLAMENDTFNYKFDSPCPAFDTSFSVLNTHCEPMTILNVQALGSTLFTLDLPTLPHTLEPDRSMPVGFSADLPTKGERAVNIRVTYEIYGRQQDTMIRVSVDALRSIGIASKILGAAFDRTSVCAPKTRTSYITNENCLDLTIESLNWTATSSPTFKTIYQPTLPRLLKSGERDSIVVEFAPDAVGPLSARMDVGLRSTALAKDTFIVFSGIGTGSVNGGVADAKIDLGSSIRCEKLTGQTTFSNDGCEAFDLVSITPNNGSFVLLSPTLPYHLEPGATVPVVFETNATAVGALAQTMQARIVTAQSVEQIIDFELAAEIVREMPRPVAAAMSLGELSDCRAYDTVITIGNPGQCDEITVEAELLSTDATFIGANTVMIPAGQTATLRIRLQPNAGTSLALRLHGDSFDTTVPINYRFVTGSRALTFNDDGAELRARLCSTAVKTFSIANPSCHPSEITRIAIDHLTGGTGVFSFVDAPQTPVTLGPGEKMTLQVQYDPALIETDISTLVIESDVQNFTSLLTGIIVEPEAVSLAFNNPGKPQLNAGELVTLDITFGLDIVTPLTFTDLVLHLEYDRDMFTLELIEPTWDWELLGQEATPGGSKFTLKHATSTFVSSDSIARVTLRSVVTKDALGVVVLAEPEINPSDPNFAGCFANTLQLDTRTPLEIAHFCGDDLIRASLANDLPVSNIRINPQPVSIGDPSMTVTLDAAAALTAGIKLVNALGVAVSSSSRELAAGSNQLSIGLQGLPSGWYTMLVETSAGTASKQVLIQK